MSLFRRRFSVAVRVAGHRALGEPVGHLRALHSGHVGDYVAWLTAGVVILGGALALAIR